MNQDAFSQSNAIVFFWLICHDFDDDGAFSAHTLCNLNNRVALSPFADALTACHSNRIVVQNLVGDVDACSNALANGQDTAVKISPIANVGKHMLLVAKVLLANPRGALAAHLCKANRAAIHPYTHEMAANAGHRTRTLGNLCTCIVRTAGTEPRHAVCRRMENQTVLCSLFGIDGLQLGLDARQDIRG